MVGVIYEDAAGHQQVANTSMVVDASGQGGLVGRQLPLRSWDSFFQNLAVYGYFTGSQRLAAPAENNIFIEAYSQGWLWNIPLHNGWASVGAVLDSATGQRGIQQSNAKHYLLQQIAQAPAMSQLLNNAVMVAGPTVVRDWSYVCQPMVGDGYILVGDAAGFTPNPTYEEACAGRTGHTEAMQIGYDPEKISFVDILRWFCDPR